jgi:hypothetical protein
MISSLELAHTCALAVTTEGVVAAGLTLEEARAALCASCSEGNRRSIPDRILMPSSQSWRVIVAYSVAGLSKYIIGTERSAIVVAAI